MLYSFSHLSDHFCLEEDKLITFIIPAYNCEKTIENCIKSIMAQDFEKETIVVDNNSNDDTASIIRKFPVGYLLEKKKGAAAARNRGLREMDRERTKYLVFIDSDVVLPERWLEKAIKILERDDKTAGVGGPGKAFDDSYTSRSLDCLLWYPITRNNNPVGSLATMDVCYRYEVIKDMFFDEELIMGEDPEFNFRIKEKGWKLIYSLELFVFHHHPISLSQLIKRWYRYGQYYPLPYWKHPNQMNVGFIGRLLYSPFILLSLGGGFFLTPFLALGFFLIFLIPLTYMVMSIKLVKSSLTERLVFTFVHSIKQYAKLVGIWKGILLGRKFSR